MNTKEAYKQKVEFELDQVQTELTESKDHPKGMTVWERAKFLRKIKGLEQKAATFKSILKDLNEGSAVFVGRADRLGKIGRKPGHSYRARYKRQQPTRKGRTDQGGTELPIAQ